MAASKSKGRPRRLSPMRREALRVLMEQPGQLTSAQVEELERAIQESLAPGAGGSQYRRAGLALLEQSGKRLIEIANTDRESGEMLADVVAGIESTVRRFRSLVDLLETSAKRALVAICARDDATELMVEARTYHDDLQTETA